MIGIYLRMLAAASLLNRASASSFFPEDHDVRIRGFFKQSVEHRAISG
jgi:hypothetical protein